MKKNERREAKQFISSNYRLGYRVYCWATFVKRPNIFKKTPMKSLRHASVIVESGKELEIEGLRRTGDGLFKRLEAPLWAHQRAPGRQAPACGGHSSPAEMGVHLPIGPEESPVQSTQFPGTWERFQSNG